MLLSVLVLLVVHVAHSNGGIKGTLWPCSNEGEEVRPESINIHDMNCYKCMCKNRIVECQKSGCPNNQGCYMLLKNDRKLVCKGCLYQGSVRPSGTEWSDQDDPCRVYKCEAGILTQATLQCYAPCEDPLPPAPGQCCPSCPVCEVNGKKVSEGRDVTINGDPCQKCHCDRGKLNCTKRTCPFLQCPATHQHKDPEECCPRCKGTRQVFEPPKGSCLLQTNVHENGKTFKADSCTECSCYNGTSICTRTTCPVLECAPERRTTPHGQCCPVCPKIEEVQTSCTINGHTYQDGESWALDPCKSCVCHQGQVRCALQNCPNQNIPCPPNFRLEHKPGECCSTCVESDGVCSVFGDPHYRTFDGKFYSFQGSCKYQLTADCVKHSFSIRVTNDARSTKTSSWTKTVSLRIGELKVNLGQKKRIKVNGKRIETPYKLHGKVSINSTRDSVQVSTNIGVRILWDGNSFLEVSVPPKYKGKLCGLCGNFNSAARDDFMTRNGVEVDDAEAFGMAWRVGGKKACARPFDQLTHEPQCQKKGIHRRSIKQCVPIKGDLFKPCHAKITPITYIKACIVDMCECPDDRCHCESFKAYAHACARQGIHIMKWKKTAKCQNRKPRQFRAARLH